MSDGLFNPGVFAFTASPETASTWAGRPDGKRRAQRLVHQMFNRSESSLDIVWANFGAGKTHFLLHLIEMAKKEAGSHRFLPSYVEVPEQTRQFLDVYRRVLASWPLENVANAIQEFGSAESDLARAAQTYIHGGAAERSLIHDWIGGGRPSLKDLRNASGISTRIDDDIRAAEILSQIISAFAARSQRVMLCLDEFQRLAFGNPKSHSVDHKSK
nr:hypothetical protein [Mesorhizobium ciceri]